jgi:hypothetical protein
VEKIVKLKQIVKFKQKSAPGKPAQKECAGDSPQSAKARRCIAVGGTCEMLSFGCIPKGVLRVDLGLCA